MPSPYIEVHIDFDEDQILESGEEVSADLRSYLLTRGKDVQSNRAPAATLLMTMNDKALKYMPPNTASPLFPFQLPGPDIRLRMAYPYDAFTGSNGASLNGRTMPQADDQTKDDPAFGDWIADSEFEIETNHIENRNEAIR